MQRDTAVEFVSTHEFHLPYMDVKKVKKDVFTYLTRDTLSMLRPTYIKVGVVVSSDSLLFLI